MSMQTEGLSRRRLLVTGVAGGAAWCWSRKLPAADKLEPFTFHVVSDTHLGRNNNTSAEKNFWRKAIAEINTQPGEFVLHLGDVVDSGRRAQYPVYTETRKTLRKPIHEIPGNHDPSDLFTEYVHPKTDRAFDHGGVRFLLFNNAHRDSHDGFITGPQIAWLEQQLDVAAARDLKVVICCHVPIHANRHPDRGWYVKPADGQDAFYALQRRHADRMLATLHGHFHNGIRGWRDHDRMVEVLCPSVCYNQNRNLKEHLASGKATGFFVDELRPGYLVAELGGGRLTLQYKPLGADLNPNGKFTAEWS